ncbi:MAG: UDP-N-acetylmuramoyl-L-alanine--D-glutamate ligase [Elusimicrobia bacterium]|nr:UDP-N-acetylmuramoyl-L-alanine--D-glutamate ligase [Elusimicrobiota bacterium]
MIKIKNKKILVCGWGATGKSAASFLRRKGAVVAVSDARKIRPPKGVVFIPQSEIADNLTGFDLLLLSPGIDPRKMFVRKAKKMKIPVAGEFEFVWQFLPASSKKIIVTGTNGKSTVTTLIAGILNSAGRPCVACGNLGRPLSAVADRLGRDIIVAEASSFQLERQFLAGSFSADVRILLNITADHISRHGSFGKYAEIKRSVFSGIANGQFGISGVAVRRKNVFILGRDIKFNGNAIVYSRAFRKRFPGIREFSLKLSRVKFFFEANRDNILASVAAVAPFGIPAEKIERAIYEFRPLPHRLEKVGAVDGVEFIDDSKATNVSSTVFALRSLSKPVILILGGRDKGTSLRPILRYAGRIKKIVAYGEAGRRIRENFRGRIPVKFVENFFDAADEARRGACQGDVVLLSPACSSYDQFENFEKRGNAFKRWLKNITKKKR